MSTAPSPPPRALTSSAMQLYVDVLRDAWQLARREVPRLLTVSGMLSLLPHVWRLLCKYWSWLLAAAIVRRVLSLLRRMLLRRFSSRGHRHHRHCRHAGDGQAATSSLRRAGDNDSRASSEHTASTMDRRSYFTATSAPSTASPAASRMLVGDDVIVVDRDGRYVEVYERKGSKRSATTGDAASGSGDDVDAKVAALVRSFERRARN